MLRRLLHEVKWKTRVVALVARKYSVRRHETERHRENKCLLLSVHRLPFRSRPCFFFFFFFSGRTAVRYWLFPRDRDTLLERRSHWIVLRLTDRFLFDFSRRFFLFATAMSAVHPPDLSQRF